MTHDEFIQTLTGRGAARRPSPPATPPAKPKPMESFVAFQKRLMDLPREEYVARIAEHDSSGQAAKRAGEAWDRAHGVTP